MTTQQAITILRQHNAWRRGDDTPMQEPKDIGEAIEVAVVIMEMVISDVDKPLDKPMLYDL